MGVGFSYALFWNPLQFESRHFEGLHDSGENLFSFLHLKLRQGLFTFCRALNASLGILSSLLILVPGGRRRIRSLQLPSTVRGTGRTCPLLSLPSSGSEGISSGS